MNYALERENNIIKNIAREVDMECIQVGLPVSPELAVYMVKLKMLNPKNGFTATEVMPRNRIQQLVSMVVDDMKEDNPSMNCIRMQVYWTSVRMDVAELKNEFLTILSDAQQTHIKEAVDIGYEETRIVRELALCTMVGYSVGDPAYLIDLKETMAAVHSVFKTKDLEEFLSLSREDKTEMILTICKRVAGIRLYLKYTGKAGDGISSVDNLPLVIEDMKWDLSKYNNLIKSKIQNIREVISILIPLNYFSDDVTGIPHGVVQNLPQDCEESDLKYLKQILVIMLQHRDYLAYDHSLPPHQLQQNIHFIDVVSKVEEIDGEIYYFLREFDQVMIKLQQTIRDRDAVPTTDVFDDFEKAGEIWLEIQSYAYSLEMIEEVARHLEKMNKSNYFEETNLEKSFTLTRQDSSLSVKMTSSSKSMRDQIQPDEDIYCEFNGYCAWVLYFTDGLLLEGYPHNGIHSFEGLHYQFSSATAYDLWAKNPKHCLMAIYEYMRNNPELIEYLKSYDNLYEIKSLLLETTTDKKGTTRALPVQTEVHPIEENWDKDYTFSLWELKKRALALSRLVKCVTKSAQTVSPHSHFRASIGLLAAPDKDKEVQTKRDSQCNHPTISTYLYGLRGHKEDKFCIVDLTRPIDESFQRKIALGEEDECRARKKISWFREISSEPCTSTTTSTSKSTSTPTSTEDTYSYTYNYFSDYLDKYYGGEQQ